MTSLAVDTYGDRQHHNGVAFAAVGRADGSFEIINPATGHTRCRLNAVGVQDKDPSIVGTEATGVNTSGDQVPRLVAITAGGNARLVQATGLEESSCEIKEISRWNVSPDVCCTALDKESNILAIGSKSTELRTYDVGQSDHQPVFVAKGGKANKVGLSDRPWNSAVAFFPGTNGAKVWVGTGYHKIRLYDSTAGKRPQLELSFGDARITALAPEPDGQRCWVADAQGRLEVYDVRGGRMAGAIQGAAGSLRSLSVHPDGGMIASGGLDRFLRVHDTAQRRSLGKVYLKTQLTEVAWLPFVAERDTDATERTASPTAVDKVEQEFDRAAKQPSHGKKQREGPDAGTPLLEKKKKRKA